MPVKACNVANHFTNGLNMSLDSESKGGTENPIAGTEPPKSKKKLWIFGGLGCLGLIAICSTGIFAVAMIYFYRPMQEFTNENVATATSLPDVEFVLGAPVTAGPVSRPESDGQGGFIFRTKLTGPDGEGDLVFTGKRGNPIGEPWVRESIYIEVDGKKTDLDTESIFNLEIDEGF